MKWFNRLLKQDPASREGIITRTSALGIFVNALIAAVKVIIGLMSSSVAIVSEGANNATDALSSVLTLLGSRLASKHPDSKHPFGYGRIEYLSGLAVAVIILVAGIEALISSIKLIFHPEALQVSKLTLIIVACTAVIKFILGIHTIRMGKKASSDALIGVGKECRSDSFASLITIVSSLLYLFLGWNLDAYAGVLISLLIIKAGAETLRDTISELLGRPGEKELATKLYKEIRGTKGIIGAADMMLHNYGPEAYSGSVNVEIDHNKTTGEIYAMLHKLQLRIMHEYRVTMVFGVYAVDRDHEHMRQLRRDLGDFVKSHPHVTSYHAVYVEPETEKIYCDLVVDYEQNDWDGLRDELNAVLNNHYPGHDTEITIETDFV